MRKFFRRCIASMFDYAEDCALDRIRNCECDGCKGLAVDPATITGPVFLDATAPVPRVTVVTPTDNRARN